MGLFAFNDGDTTATRHRHDNDKRQTLKESRACWDVSVPWQCEQAVRHSTDSYLLFVPRLNWFHNIYLILWISSSWLSLWVQTHYSTTYIVQSTVKLRWNKHIISLHPVVVQCETNWVLPSTYNFNYNIMFCFHCMFQLNVAIFRCLSIDKLLSA
jgi:hypothetical protein